jgi:hypothetical protein
LRREPTFEARALARRREREIARDGVPERAQLGAAMRDEERHPVGVCVHLERDRVLVALGSHVHAR